MTEFWSIYSDWKTQLRKVRPQLKQACSVEDLGNMLRPVKELRVQLKESYNSLRLQMRHTQEQQRKFDRCTVVTADLMDFLRVRQQLRELESPQDTKNLGTQPRSHTEMRLNSRSQESDARSRSTTSKRPSLEHIRVKAAADIAAKRVAMEREAAIAVERQRFAEEAQRIAAERQQQLVKVESRLKLLEAQRELEMREVRLRVIKEGLSKTRSRRYDSVYSETRKQSPVAPITKGQANPNMVSLPPALRDTTSSTRPLIPEPTKLTGGNALPEEIPLPLKVRRDLLDSGKPVSRAIVPSHCEDLPADAPGVLAEGTAAPTEQIQPYGGSLEGIPLPLKVRCELPDSRKLASRAIAPGHCMDLPTDAPGLPAGSTAAPTEMVQAYGGSLEKIPLPLKAQPNLPGSGKPISRATVPNYCRSQPTESHSGEGHHSDGHCKIRDRPHTDSHQSDKAKQKNTRSQPSGQSFTASRMSHRHYRGKQHPCSDCYADDYQHQWKNPQPRRRCQPRTRSRSYNSGRVRFKVSPSGGGQTMILPSNPWPRWLLLICLPPHCLEIDMDPVQGGLLMDQGSIGGSVTAGSLMGQHSPGTCF